MATIIKKSELPSSGSSWTFEGYQHGAANVSFFLSETPAGRGPRLHKHPYEEVFIVQAGQLTFTVGDETVVADAECVVVVPPNTPHKFVNTGTEVAKHIDLHINTKMETDWLEK